MAYRGINDSLSRDSITILMGGSGVTNGTASATAGTESNGTYSVAGGVNVVILKNVQLYNGGGTAASNDTRFVLEIPATGAALSNPLDGAEHQPGQPLSFALPQSEGPQRLLAVGDSWASAKRSDTGRDDGWPEILNIADELRQGVDGSTAVQWDADKDGMLSRALATPCEKVVVSLGGSDAFAIKADPSNMDAKIANAGSALGRVVAKFQDKVGKENVWVLLYANPWPDRPDAVIGTAALKGTIMAACPTGTQFWDTGKVLTAECFSNGDYHPNLEGSVRECDDVQRVTGWSVVGGAK